MSDVTARRSVDGWNWLLICLLLFAAIVQFTFFDRSWYPPDDGAYASVAARIVQGEVLNRDVHDVHAGYINFLNAGAIAVFGDSLLGLRYPLVLAALSGVALAWFVLLPLGVVPAVTGGLAVACLSVLPFPNPTPHWYCVPLLLALLLCLRTAKTRTALVVAGLLLGLAFLLRQLTGAILSIAALLVVADRIEPEQSSSVLPTRVALLACAVLLSMYFLKRMDVFSFLIFGFPVIAGLIVTAANTQLGTRSLILSGGWIAVGMAAAALPLLSYHLWYGSLGIWFDQAVTDAVALSGQGFMEQARYRSAAMDALQLALGGGGVQSVANAWMWLLLFLLPLVVGIGAVVLLLRREAEVEARTIICVGASVYALVSVHYQIPVYLWYTTAVSAVGLAALAAPFKWARWTVLAVVSFVALTALYGQAAQPLDRGMQGILAGEREQSWSHCSLPRMALEVPKRDCALYGEILQQIDALAGPGAPIAVFPSDAELYYLSGRGNPFAFFNSALGIRSTVELQEAIRILNTSAPTIVIWREGDKYETDEARKILQYVEHHYALERRIGAFRVYARSSAQAAGR